MVTFLHWVHVLLSSVYLLRFPLLTLALLLGLPYAALKTNARSLLAGLFDIETGALGMAVVTLGALATAWAVMLTSWLVLAYGSRRFDVEFLAIKIPFSVWVPGLSLAALPTLIAAVLETTREGKRHFRPLLSGMLAGAAVAGLLLWIAASFHDDSLERWVAQELAARSNLAAGYVNNRDPANPVLLPNHGLAFFLFLTLFLSYTVIGRAKYARLGRRRTLPALAYVLLLLMLLCWGLSGLAFFFDRYRIPVLMLLAGLAILTSLSSRSDHYYRVRARENTDSLPPATVIRGDGKRKWAVVVAANGGGIQSAAWTARVLTGLELKCRQEFGENFREFGQSIRLISSVSGGSVGSMYFVAAYSGSGLPDSQEGLEQVVRRAEASSLDAVAWGLVYPDFWRQIFPFLWRKEVDRGRALEEALTAQHPAALLGAVGHWREGVREGWRPANIFNATIADTGERLLISTSDLSKASFGRRSFYDNDLYPNDDVSVVTAARLSATFPYVSPVARASLAGPQPHVADGGYYDNYGISTVLDWLDEALQAPNNPIKRVLLIEIRGAPFDEMMVRHNERGWFYQASAPIATMLHVRTTGQLAHNEVEVKLFDRLYDAAGVQIEPVVFQFHEPVEKQRRHVGPPLSWHLTQTQKQDIEDAWQAELASGSGWPVVRSFLSASQASVFTAGKSTR